MCHMSVYTLICLLFSKSCFMALEVSKTRIGIPLSNLGQFLGPIENDKATTSQKQTFFMGKGVILMAYFEQKKHERLFSSNYFL